MRIDGKAIAEEVRAELKAQVEKMYQPPRLGVIIAQETFIVRKFVDIKEAFAEGIGVTVTEKKLDPLATQQDLLQAVFHVTEECDGMIVQLPLPHQMDVEVVRQILPASHDVDLLGVTAYEQFVQNRLPLLPPVVGAIAEILHRNGYSPKGRKVAIIGEGRLVGAPALEWAKRMGATVTVLARNSEASATTLREADIIISGTGVPGLIKPSMVKEGVILLDAGTSEVGGKLVGDIDPQCESKAALFTPTPGGIGPLTVAMVFKNLLKLMELRSGTGLDTLPVE